MKHAGTLQTTTPTDTVLLPSREVPDTTPNSGMTRGATESNDKLAEMLAAILALGDSQVGA